MKKVVIIGAVATGLKSAAKIRRCDSQAKITVVEKGELISYGACGLPYFVAGDVGDINQLMSGPAGAMRSPDFFKNVRKVDVHNNTLATKIDREAKTVTVTKLATGEADILFYDKLVIATGANPVKPSIPGGNLANIHQLWHPDDAVAIRQGLAQGKFKQRVIIGAGLIGMEMAEALKKWNIQVTVIEMKDQVFPAFLDAEIAGPVANYAQDNGITILTNEKVERFSGQGMVQAVVTDKRTVAADLVIIAVGARPNVELAQAAGLTIGATGAIAVNEYM